MVLKGNDMKLILLNEGLIIKGRVRLILQDVKTGIIDVSEWKNNLITTVGKQMVLNRLGNRQIVSNEGMITYGALGTGTNVPATTDTTLQTEVARRLVSVVSLAGTTLTIRCFFPTGDANGTNREFGWFGEDADATPDSGTLFNRIAINKTKTVDKTLTVEQEISLT